ncbi:CRISPR-associated endonuclease Cas2 [Flammeovirga sp. SJP92]|uniref:CRISPR-associated endonuclease Cas2 n=1 Tax=Flammeovirga sp. SJP92 TaxID=1775430 RepID=UPI0007885E3E|nr:CRISPR-associated endonuclease Cas2 [Flammeovirga sp. SJP92]KXX69429.1 hypothetical protein AVL50_19320 [Flammeovirga sp. SJP92]
MRYLICYDISDNKLRTSVMKTILKHGCDRIQKSVFISLPLKKKGFHLMYDELRALLEEKGDTEDSLFFFPMDSKQLQSSQFIGNENAIQKIYSHNLTKYF